MSESIWYYADSGGVQHGPVTEEALQEAVANRQVLPTTLVWREGMADWRHYADIPEFAAASRTVTPAIPTLMPAAMQPAGQWVVPAGFGRRFLALMLDNIIITLPLMLVGAVVLPLALGGSNNEATSAAVGGLFYLAYWVVAALYYALQESSSSQATLGKRALGIKVTDLDGRRIGFGQALGRWFAAALSYLTFYVGFLMAAFTDRRRGLHDMVAGTLVVDRWAYTDQPQLQKTGLSGCLVALLVAMVLVIPVMGILAVIAIPAYQDYTVRAKVAEVLNEAAAPKLAVAEYATTNGHCPVNGEGGIGAADSFAATHVQSIVVGAMENGHCALEIVVRNTGRPEVDGKRVWLEMSPNETPSWACSSEIADKYLPATCRK